MRCPNHWLKVKLLDNKIKMGDIDLVIDPSFEPQDHVSTKGIVLQVPENLDELPWRTEVEVEKGDLVYMNYHAVLLALGRSFDRAQENPSPLYDEDGIYIKYSDLYMSDKNMLNGYVLVELMPQKMPDTSLVIPERLKKLKSKRIAKVLKVGSMNKGYDIDVYEDADVSVGDCVVFMDYSNLRLEQELYRTAGDVCVVQRRHIMATVDYDKVGVMI